MKYNVEKSVTITLTPSPEELNVLEIVLEEALNNLEGLADYFDEGNPDIIRADEVRALLMTVQNVKFLLANGFEK